LLFEPGVSILLTRGNRSERIVLVKNDLNAETTDFPETADSQNRRRYEEQGAGRLLV
jgi:hypothetical protein